MIPLRALGLLLLAPLLAGCGVTEVVERAPDGRPILIRSPQPDAADLAELDAAYRVTTVVNLRGEKPEEGWFQEERAGVEAIGARWLHMGVSGRSGPTPAEVTSFLDLVEDSAAWPILIHCQGGVHRTGVMTALYRIQYDGWPAEDAIAEMEDKWFDWTTTDRSGVKEFLRRYRRDPERRLPSQGAGERAGDEAAPAGDEAAAGDEAGPRAP